MHWGKHSSRRQQEMPTYTRLVLNLRTNERDGKLQVQNCCSDLKICSLSLVRGESTASSFVCKVWQSRRKGDCIYNREHSVSLQRLPAGKWGKRPLAFLIFLSKSISPQRAHIQPTPTSTVGLQPEKMSWLSLHPWLKVFLGKTPNPLPLTGIHPPRKRPCCPKAQRAARASYLQPARMCFTCCP